MTQRTVAANELAIKALRCPDGKARVVYHVDGYGNEGLKLYVESGGTKTLVLPGSGARQRPQRHAARPLAGRDHWRGPEAQECHRRFNL